MKIKRSILIVILCAVPLISQENPDSLYRDILTKKKNGNLSIIQVDQSIALEMQKSSKNATRLSELFFYRGELLQNEKRYEEAISAYDSTLSYPSEKWISEKVYFNRGLVYENFGLIKSRQKATEKLAASQLFWFGRHSTAELFSTEFKKAELDFKAVESRQAKEQLLQLYFIAGKIDEANSLLNELKFTPTPDETMKSRLKAYEILLLEGKEDFMGSDRLKSNMDPAELDEVNLLLYELRSRRLLKTITFDWIDRTVHEMYSGISERSVHIETSPFYALDLNYSLKRLMFSNVNGGFLVSGNVESSGLIKDNQCGVEVGVHILGTYLNRNISFPGGGISFKFKSYDGTGIRILRNKNEFVSEKSESGFGFNLNAGIRHKLFAFIAYDQESTWLNGISEYLSISGKMFNSLGINVVEIRSTQGVYGMGMAGTGWWPGKSNIHSSQIKIGVNTNLSRNLTFGTSYLGLCSSLTDHEELSVNHMSYTYAHSCLLNERISLLRLNAETKISLFGLGFSVGGHHCLKFSSRILINERNARIVTSIPESDGSNPVLLNAIGDKMDAENVAFMKKINGYFPSASELYLRLNYSKLVFSVEYRVHGFRLKNREIRFAMGIRTKEIIPLQSLHDLAWWQ